jgi:hypothetical protein
LCLEGVAAEALTALETEQSLPTENPSPTWTIRFIGYAEETPDPYLQHLWGQILAGEIKQPGSYSLRTLDVLSTMTHEEAKLFTYVAKHAFWHPYDLYIPCEAARFLSGSGIRHRNLTELAEIGLLQPTTTLLTPFRGGATETTFAFSDHVAVRITKDPAKQRHIELGIGLDVWIFTRAARELTKFFLWETPTEYIDVFCEGVKEVGWVAEAGTYTDENKMDFHPKP